MDDILKLIDSRKCFIWGARHDGYAAKISMERHGIKPVGYIDSSMALKGCSAFGLQIQMPEDFFLENTPKGSFILIASGFFTDEISKLCEKKGWKNGRDFIAYRSLRYFNYQIDISGKCNLKCISCPRGNWIEHRKTGFMSLKLYKHLLKKILNEDPWVGIITLYNWGEPILHPELPEIIHVTHNNGLLAAISSNLAFKKDFKAVIEAKPDWFRISNSAWGTNYEITHTGAKWDVFLENCYKLSNYVQKYSPTTIVELFFHIYSHNRGDFIKLQKLCRKLGFILRYRHAALAPLDNIDRILQGKSISNQAEQTRNLQFLKVEEVMKIALRQRKRPCYYMDHLWIDWDLSVPQCMEWYDPSLKLFDNVLNVSLEKIKKTRLNSPHCKYCMEKGIHRIYCVYGDEKLILKKSSIPITKE
ncbi:MAG TPA: hypothetical protein P5239_10205 [Victivallales bacterium]|nr:hypothetical protein [Victivallales bacterium]